MLPEKYEKILELPTKVYEDFTITEKAPNFWLKAPSALTFKKQAPKHGK